MADISRRTFGRLVGLAGAGAALQGATAPAVLGERPPRIVIVGGGAGGATVAHYLRNSGAALDVTLIEASPIYSSSFFSNLYLGGFRALETLNHSYVGLQKLGIKVVGDTATDVDTSKKLVRTKAGRVYRYDRLVLSPGIDIKYDAIPGYSREAARGMPHAYTTAAHGKRVLKRQLKLMRDGGTVVIAPPPNPYRCPPGPYERACMIAHYLKTRKPRSKLIILDPKKSFSKQPVITEAFEKYYKGIVELHLSTEIDDYAIARVLPSTRQVITRAGLRVKADVANIIPPQRAGEIAVKAGCTDGDWCPVDPDTFRSRRAKDVYVLGDASVAAEMPKSAFSANSQAKVVAADILADVAKAEKFPARFRNTCWSLLAPDDCVKIGANYSPKGGKLDPFEGFVSQRGEAAEVRKQNYQESVSWYDAITADMFAVASRKT